MRKITFLKTMLLAAVLLVGSGNAFGAQGDIIYTLSGGTGQPFGSSNTYELKSGTYINNSLSVGWTATLGSCQNASTFWFGSNSTQKAKLTLGSSYSAVGLPCGISATDTYVAALISNTNFSNVGKITVANSSTAGSSASALSVFIVYSTNNGASYSLASTSQTAVSSGTLTFEFNTIPSARYAIVIKGANDWTFRVPMITFFEGAVAPTCTASNLAFANPTVNKTTADAPFTVAATSLNATTAITYTSDNTAVATVNATTGEVTVVGAGTAKITATQAAGTHAAVDYCASTAEYTLTVASTTPTITITETSVPAMTTVVGSTDTETIHISGINLTGSINLYFRADNSDRVKGKSVNIPITSVFEVSPATITTIGGTVASTPITITYTPLEAGIHRATLVVSSDGANTVELPFEGIATWAPLPAPVATDASGVNNAGFTANWEAVAEAIEYDVDVYTKETSVISATDLFFSEYIEGGSNNKAIEIYNGTGESVDLSVYSVELYANGANTPGNTLAMTGTLANGDVYVIYNSGSVVGIKDVGDVESTVTFFNGDDALVLKKNGTIIDSFGQVGVDPGSAWTANGVTTLDKTLVRKPSVTAGRTAATTVFDPSVEWIQYNIDTFDYLGSHTMTATGVVITPIAGSPFTVTGETSKTISGLSAETTYYYTVRAFDNFVGSDVSNEVSVTTGPTTGVDKTEESLNVRVSGNQIQFSASANQTVEVFNAIGQKLITRQTVEGLNTMAVSARGVVFVKLGDKVTKVIL